MSDSGFTVGWREWVALPGLDVPAIKAKIDTGARTSAMNALDIERFTRDGSDFVAFTVLPLQRNDQVRQRCEAPLIDIRKVTDSGGHAEQRHVIETELSLGPQRYTMEMTLTERRGMLFRMLVGRRALAGHWLVDPAQSFIYGRPDLRELYPSTTEKPT